MGSRNLSTEPSSCSRATRVDRKENIAKKDEADLRAESAATSAPCCNHKKRSAAVWSEATGMDDRRVRCYKRPLLQPQKTLYSGLERSDNYKLLPPPRMSVIASGAATPLPRLAPLLSSTVSPSPGARNRLVSRPC